MSVKNEKQESRVGMCDVLWIVSYSIFARMCMYPLECQDENGKHSRLVQKKKTKQKFKWKVSMCYVHCAYVMPEWSWHKYWVGMRCSLWILSSTVSMHPLGAKMNLASTVGDSKNWKKSGVCVSIQITNYHLLIIVRTSRRAPENSNVSEWVSKCVCMCVCVCVCVCVSFVNCESVNRAFCEWVRWLQQTARIKLASESKIWKKGFVCVMSVKTRMASTVGGCKEI